MRSHSSTACRKSSEVFNNSPARRPGSAEYIGIRQPVKLAMVSPVKAANISLRIAPFLREIQRRNPRGQVRICQAALREKRQSTLGSILDVPSGFCGRELTPSAVKDESATALWP